MPTVYKSLQSESFVRRWDKNGFVPKQTQLPN